MNKQCLEVNKTISEESLLIVKPCSDSATRRKVVQSEHLIPLLLTYPNKAITILEENQDLLSTELVQMMEQVAERMSANGSQQAADFLQDLADRIKDKFANSTIVKLDQESRLVAEEPKPVVSVEEQTTAKKSRFPFLKQLLLLLSIGGIAVLGGFLWKQQSHTTKSIQAFINSEIIYVRTPISGKLSLKTKPELGRSLKSSEILGSITADVENSLVSQLKINQQQLRSTLENNKQRLAGLNQQLAKRISLLAEFSTADQEQQQLQVEYSQAQISQVEDELNKAQADADLAKAEVDRANFLLAKGAVSKAYQQEKEAAAKRAAAEVEAIKSRLTQNQLTLKASAKGLQLDGPRTYSYPQIRAIELQTEITDLQKEIADLNREIEGNQADLARVSQELNTQHQVTVKVPQNGVIWSIDAQPGEALSANDPILQLIDCQNVWVEAFINEKEAASLSVGQSVDVHLIGTDTVLPGKLQTLRAGTGRVTVGQNVVDPPPEIERRQLPVRVVTARIQVDWPEPPSPENFCRAGRSVEVRTTKEI